MWCLFGCREGVCSFVRSSTSPLPPPHTPSVRDPFSCGCDVPLSFIHCKYRKYHQGDQNRLTVGSNFSKVSSCWWVFSHHFLCRTTYIFFPELKRLKSWSSVEVIEVMMKVVGERTMLRVWFRAPAAAVSSANVPPGVWGRHRKLP